MESPSKKCSKCFTFKPLTDYHKGDCSGGKQPWCKKCATALMLVWRQKNRARSNEISRQSASKHRERRNTYHKAYYYKNREAQLIHRRNYTLTLKNAVYAAYGGYRCVCCGEAEPMFLSIDHVNNDGSEHRKQLGGKNFYKWLKDHRFPPGFQVLCMNCNCGKKMNGGKCPHEAIHGLTITEV